MFGCCDSRDEHIEELKQKLEITTAALRFAEEWYYDNMKHPDESESIHPVAVKVRAALKEIE